MDVAGFPGQQWYAGVRLSVRLRTIGDPLQGQISCSVLALKASDMDSTGHFALYRWLVALRRQIQPLLIRWCLAGKTMLDCLSSLIHAGVDQSRF
jgi:hypothetical protein